ncbi:helix-turn-helix transcriptional regulator [Luteibaculum oceani]|uniref:Helix-turn-helix domain-containing protein n=1 Tax=Luteibaculum oceani TaxID=1294296 RepID=A0A5C6US40_9FLAO|nr:helix-turn-helix domain-containing protein [Luteibaculum oceani]TXC76047.1 helix-turn-helix domain-containing protein [Luteibaculum oceani]
MSLAYKSDKEIIEAIANYIKQRRLAKNITQQQLADDAGLNRWTISQAENGEALNTRSLIQILRALDALSLLNQFEWKEEISPLEYAKLKKQERQRARPEKGNEGKEDLGW